MIPDNPRTALLLGVALGLFVVPVAIRVVARRTTRSA